MCPFYVGRCETSCLINVVMLCLRMVAKSAQETLVRYGVRRQHLWISINYTSQRRHLKMSVKCIWMSYLENVPKYLCGWLSLSCDMNYYYIIVIF